MKYKKIKNGEGDFSSFNTKKLFEELIGAIGETGKPQKWHLETNDSMVHVIIHKKDEVNAALVDAVVRNHFETDWSKYEEPDILQPIRDAKTLAQLKQALLEIL